MQLTIELTRFVCPLMWLFDGQLRKQPLNLQFVLPIPFPVSADIVSLKWTMFIAKVYHCRLTSGLAGVSSVNLIHNTKLDGDKCYSNFNLRYISGAHVEKRNIIECYMTQYKLSYSSFTEKRQMQTCSIAALYNHAAAALSMEFVSAVGMVLIIYDTRMSILVQVTAWCRQAPSHYLDQCWNLIFLGEGSQTHEHC